MSSPIETPQIRYLGPYQFRGQWRCQLVNGASRTWMTPEKTPERSIAIAERVVAAYLAQQPMTVGKALEAYGEYKLIVRANKPASVTTTLHRLRRFFSEPGIAVYQLTHQRCAGYYQKLVATQKPDTHRNTLAEAGTFCRWLIKRRNLKLNPIEGIEGVGRKRKGKPQLRYDEARKWWAKAEELANEGHAGAVAAMMTLVMALRASEITSRTVRDIDNGGRLLWIPEAKTPAGKRQVKVPEKLRPYLLRLSSAKPSTAFIFTGKHGAPHERAWPRKWVQKICKLAKVPEVCAHSMRGLHASLAIQAGTSPDVVAGVMGHESPAITMSNYAVPGSAEAARADRATSALLPN